MKVSGDDQAEARAALECLAVKLLQAGERRGRGQAAGADMDRLPAIARACPDTRLDELIRVAGSRWAIEECCQSAKQECGLDDYQVRRYLGWHRDMTLAMAARACLTVLRARELDAGKAETDPPRSSTSVSRRYDG